MNPLKRQQQELLERIGCKDLSDKVQELVREFNKIEKPEEETSSGGKAVGETARAIYDAGSQYEAEMILKDFLKKGRKLKS